MSTGDQTAAAARSAEGARTAAGHTAPRPQDHRGLPGYLRDAKPLVKQLARLALVTARLPTSPARMMPSFLIVGAQRCGECAGALRT